MVRNALKELGVNHNTIIGFTIMKELIENVRSNEEGKLELQQDAVVHIPHTTFVFHKRGKAFKSVIQSFFAFVIASRVKQQKALLNVQMVSGV